MAVNCDCFRLTTPGREGAVLALVSARFRCSVELEYGADLTIGPAIEEGSITIVVWGRRCCPRTTWTK